MADTFSSYEEEYVAIRDAINKALSNDEGDDAQAGGAQQRGEVRKAALRRVERDMDEAEEILDQLEMAARGQPKLMAKVRSTYRKDLPRWRAELKDEQSKIDRSALLGRPGHTAYAVEDEDEGDGYDVGAAQRASLLRGTNTLQDGSARLTDTQRLALESEEIGHGVLGSLRRQGDQLRGTRDTLNSDVDRNLSRSTRTIKDMVKLSKRNKVLMWSVLVFFVFLIILLLYIKLR